MSKVNVKIIAGDYEGVDISENEVDLLSHKFTFKYCSLTKIQKLLLAVCKKCNVEIDQGYPFRFQLLHNDNNYFLNPNVRLNKLFKYLNISDEITFVYLFGVPGGKSLDETNGISYFIHIKETNHTPHIHATYSGEEVSIYLNTGKIIGSFKSKTKMKQAKKHVDKNKDFFMDAYVKYTNGIVVFY